MSSPGARIACALVYLVAAAFLGVGCAATALRQRPGGAARLNGGWQTLRGEHRITVDVERRTYRLRAVVAIARPDRVRLRALGPGGITLFDVLARGDQVMVLRTLPRMSASTLSPLIDTIVADLGAAYDLQPHAPDRTIEVTRSGVSVREGQRELRLTRFRSSAGRVYPSRIEILDRARRYHVRVDAAATWLDEPLDAALFAPNAR